MRISKNGITYDLIDKTQIEAFLGSGWIPVEDSARVDDPPPASLDETKKPAGRPRKEQEDSGS